MSPFSGTLFSLLVLLLRVSSKKPLFGDLNDVEKEALLSFIRQVPHHPRYKWDKSESPCHTPWRGVTCDPATNTTVFYLALPGASLIGPIPPDTIVKLTSLRILSLRNNRLNGTIPSDFITLQLRSLSLDNNRFSGQLPDLNVLEKLNVSNNKLTGPIPTSLNKFNKTAFSKNSLCGAPLRPCSGTTFPPPPPSPPPPGPNNSKNKPLIIGISIGSGLLLLILLCFLRRKMYPESKKLVQKPSIEAPADAARRERNKLVLFGNGINGFDLEDLLEASAEVLGRGSVGTSYKQVLEGKGMTVVVKRLKDVVVTKAEFESKMEELGRMRNENVVPLRACYYSNNEKWLVYDYMPAGSLSALLHGSTGLSGARLGWNHRMSIAISAARGVAYLHASKVIHGNIKSSNILLRKETNKDASVSDYGLNTLFDRRTSSTHRVTGYMAPEVLETQNISFKSDVYSFGILLLELLTRKAPNKALSGEVSDDFTMWVQSVVHEEPKVEIFDMELRREVYIKEMFQMLRIAKDCVSIVPEKRPTMQEVESMMEEIHTDDWLRQSFDDPSKGYDDTPSTDTRGTPSTITP